MIINDRRAFLVSLFLVITVPLIWALLPQNAEAYRKGDEARALERIAKALEGRCRP